MSVSMQRYHCLRGSPQAKMPLYRVFITGLQTFLSCLSCAESQTFRKVLEGAELVLRVRRGTGYAALIIRNQTVQLTSAATLVPRGCSAQQ